MKRKGKQKSAASDRARRAPSRSRLASPIAWRRLALAASWVLALSGVAYGIHALERFSIGHAAEHEWTLYWVNIPSTLDDWIVDEIERERYLYDLRPLYQLDLHDPSLCPRIADALGRSPWILAIKRVQKQSDGRVLVDAQFREYLTFVVRNRMGYLVDARGVRLPREQAADFLKPYDMILIEGVEAPVPKVGQAWNSEAVLGGLKLVRFLNQRCPGGLRSAIEAVDVSNYGNRRNARDGWLSIRTIHPKKPIRWGRPPGDENNIECQATRKLENLWTLYSRHGQLPPLANIDVRDENGVLYEPETP